jgi:hypothetical protein
MIQGFSWRQTLQVEGLSLYRSSSATRWPAPNAAAHLPRGTRQVIRRNAPSASPQERLGKEERAAEQGAKPNKAMPKISLRWLGRLLFEAVRGLLFGLGRLAGEVVKAPRSC